MTWKQVCAPDMCTTVYMCSCCELGLEPIATMVTVTGKL